MNEMAQIKENQVVPSRIVRRNPLEAPPRDLSLDFVDAQNLPVETTIPSQPTNFPTEAQPNPILPPSTLPIVHLDTPLITDIKSQTINFQGDGSATVDVVLTVTNISGAKEYDIRITKDEGVL